jgi:thioredoxin reductase (NADPH)
MQCKYWIRPDLENRIKDGAIKARLGAAVVEINPRSVVLQTADGTREELANDVVLALIGYRPDPALLAQLGVATDARTRQPLFNPETYESRRPGVYLAGVMLAGDLGGAIFIENSRHHGERILAHLQSQRKAPAPGARRLEENTFL